MLHLHNTRRYEVPFESLTEQFPINHSVGWKSFPILIPPDACRTLQLMSYILCLQTFSQPKQAELLFHRVQPFFSLQGFFGFSERWGLCIHEVLEDTVLIRSWPFMCITTTLIRHPIDGLSEHPLIFHHHLHQLSWIW